MSKPIFVNGRFLTQETTGIQRFSYEMCKALIAGGTEVIILAPKKIRNEYTLNCRIIRFGIFSGILWEQVDLPVFLRTHKNPLLINFGSPGPVFYTNRIVTVHDLSFYVKPSWYKKSYRLYYRLVTPVALHLSKKVITVSEFSKNEILRLTGITREKIAIIHNAVSGALQRMPAKETAEKGKYILSVASLDPRKNLAGLVAAYKMAGIEKEFRLVLAGKSDPIFNIKITEEILAHSTGYVTDDELSSLYQNAHFFVYPSLYEGFGLPPLEAMSLGCPVILSDIPVFREIFGDAAHYVDPMDPGSICKGILHVLGDEQYRKELIRRGHERAKLYSWVGSASKLASIISTIV
ncbi:MAG: glycosyltransferase family 1 protein [Bacteroidetes bacterium]|nr:glycosyltransferase family 1 protein [Bacteroidota bacterium]